LLTKQAFTPTALYLEAEPNGIDTANATAAPSKPMPLHHGVASDV